MKKHTLTEIVKNSFANLTHICNGNLYFQIEIEDSLYQLEIDSNTEEWENVYIYPKYKSITLMRWIRKGMENDKFIQLK